MLIKLKYIVLITFMLTTYSQAGDALGNKLNYESSITQQLKDELKSLLPEKSFAVFTSVQTELIRQKVISEGESFVSKHEVTQKQEISETSLPGFVPNIEPENANRDDSQQRERQVYKMVEREQISSVSVRVLLDKGLPDELASTARTVISQRIKGSYGSMASVQFQTAELIQPLPKEPIKEPVPELKPSLLPSPTPLPVKPEPIPLSLLDLVKEWAVPAFFAILALIGLIKVLSSIVSKFRTAIPLHAEFDPSPSQNERGTPWNPRSLSNRHPTYEDSQRMLPGPFSTEQNSRDIPLLEDHSTASTPINFEELIGNFIEASFKDPLIARHFFRSIELNQKQKLSACFS